MKIRLAICLILAAAALAPMPASAQALLPPYEITTSIRSMGLEPVSPPVRRGNRYELIATDQRGVGVKVAADGFSGRVLFVEELDGPFRSTRAQPPAYPDERRSYQRQGAVEPGEPSVIYAAPRETNPPRPPARVPSVAKPPVPKVAAKPPAKPVAPAEAAAPAETSPAPSKESSDTTGSTTAAASPPPPAEKPPEKNPALVAPPVQGFD